jgi:hypothetical protein
VCVNGCDSSGPAESDDASPIGSRDADTTTDTPDATPIGPNDLPELDNYSASSDEHVLALVTQAVIGLGFPSSSLQRPNPDDRVFVGRHYIAWIDQTGFYGKMNGLWRLNGLAGDELSFAVRDGARPVNFFAVAEFGNGQWAPGYRGAEHIEFPSRTPEPNDDPGCASGDWCNQYAHSEAAPITDPDIPWWSACNAGAPAWTEVFAPVVEETISGGIRLVWEGPLVKMADGDGNFDGDDCHEDWLFTDGVRRPVMLRTGYELHGDELYFDRVMQIRNPAGNPQFDGPMSLIGGFVITRWPNPHPLKRIDLFLRPETNDVSDVEHAIQLQADTFTHHDFGTLGRDEIFAWLDQPISMSVSNDYITGRSATLSHVGPSDNADVGLCMCHVHGAIEMGGGLVHGGISLPINSDTSTIEARRRLALPGVGSGIPVERVYEAETDLSHNVGRAEADGWSASPSLDDAGHMAFGPYATDWGGGTARAELTLMVDDISADTRDVVTLEIYDATDGRLLTSRAIQWSELVSPMTYQTFALDLELTGSAGHTMEARVWWYDVTHVRLDKVTITTID